MKTLQAHDGQWYRQRDHRQCCKCGLIHREEFKIVVGDKKINKILEKHKGKMRIYYRFFRVKKLK